MYGNNVSFSIDAEAVEALAKAMGQNYLPTPQVAIPMDFPAPEGPFDLPWHDTVHRCSFCGKWSHAKRKPYSHKSWTTIPAVGKLAQNLGKNVVESEWGGWRITNCGPFVTYHASLIEEPPHLDG